MLVGVNIVKRCGMASACSNQLVAREVCGAVRACAGIAKVVQCRPRRRGKVCAVHVAVCVCCQKGGSSRGASCCGAAVAVFCRQPCAVFLRAAAGARR